MRKMLKMLSLICVMALAVTAFAIFAAADGQDAEKDNIKGADALVEAFLAADTAAEKLDKAKALHTYLGEKSVNASDAVAYYAALRCELCADANDACTDCAASAELRAEFLYARYESLVEKIMAYGAASLANGFNASAAVSNCTEARLWLEKFLQYDMADLAVSDALSPDFFSGYSLEVYAEPNLVIAEDGSKVTYTVKLINPSYSKLTLNNFSDIPSAFSRIDKVTLGDTELAANTDYTFDAKSGAPVISAVSLPGATYSKDTATGAVNSERGAVTLTVEGELTSVYTEMLVDVVDGKTVYTFKIWNTTDNALDDSYGLTVSANLGAGFTVETVKLGGTDMALNKDYTYSTKTGSFATKAGSLTVGAASTATLTVSGTAAAGASVSDEKIEELAGKVVEKVKSIEATDEYRRLVSEFTSIKRTYSQLTARTNALVAVDAYVNKFIGTNGNLLVIDTESAMYKTANAEYMQYSIYLQNDRISYDFVTAMESYLFFDAYVRKLEYYEIAESLMRSNVIDDSITEAGETRLASALVAYSNAAAELEAMVCKQNSKYFVMYMEYTQSYETEESWNENYAHLKYPVSKAREIVNSGRFDPSYEGVSELLLWYEAIEDYFYKRLQEEHVSFIGELLERYTRADNYVEKLGICERVQRYIDTAEIDPDNVTLQRLIEKNAEYLAEMSTLKDSYLSQKDRQTELFMYAVMKLEAANGYNEIREFLAEAAECYYSMTIGGTDTLTEEQVTGAIAKYDYYTEYADRVSEESERFKLIVSALDGADEYSERYLILADAGDCIEYISEDIDGVSEAYEKYLAAREDYAALTGSANAEIEQTQEAFTAVRLSVASVIVTFFAKLIGLVLN